MVFSASSSAVCSSDEDLEDFHLCCASLFAVPPTGSSSEPQMVPLDTCLTIEVLDEVRREGQTPQLVPPPPHTASLFLQKLGELKEGLVGSQTRSRSRR